MQRREYYDKLFPEVLPIDQPPQVFKTPVAGPSGRPIQTPVYSAGWTLTAEEIYRKFKPKMGVSDIVGVELVDRWDELGFDTKYNHPAIRFPRMSRHNSRDYRFVFVQNGLQEEMELFHEHRDLVFTAMCELFGIDNPKYIEIIKGRYKWYRSGVTQYHLPKEAFRITSDSLFTSDLEDNGWDSESEPDSA